MKIRPNLPKYYIYYIQSTGNIFTIINDLTKKQAHEIADEYNSTIGPYDIEYRIGKK